MLKRMQNEYIVISLYVDDRTDLPEKEQYVSKLNGKNIRNIGNKNSDLQASRYNTNSQPYYVLLDHDEQMLTPPRGHNEDVAAYIGFLDAGLKEFAERKK